MAATLAFSNDIDLADWDTYCEVHRVLENEFGIFADDSFWLFDPAGSEVALFKRSVAEKGPRHDELLEHIANGRMRVLHSAGNFSLTNSPMRCHRDLVAEGLAYLREHARVPVIWTNHGDSGDLQNIGGDQPRYQQGDAPESETYVLDLLLHYGVRFFWNDHGSRNDFVLQGRGRPGTILTRERARSGHDLTCFLRYRGALPKAPDAETLHLQITRENLDALIAAAGATIVYQHWCLHRDSEGRPFTAARPVFPESTRRALAALAVLRDQGAIDIVPVSALLPRLASASGIAA